MFLRNSWYVAAWDREIGRRPLARMILGEPIVFYRQEDDTTGRARGSLLPPPSAALPRPARRRHVALRLSRAALRCQRSLCRNPGPGANSARCGDPVLPAGRALQLGLDLDGRSETRRSGADPELVVGRSPGLGLRQARHDARRLQLSAHQRQRPRRDASRLCACVIDRQSLDQRFPGDDRARGQSGATDALDHRSPGAADVSGGGQIRRQCRSLADRRACTALLQRQFRRLRRDRHRRAARRSQPRHRADGAKRADARDRAHDALFLRLSAQIRPRRSRRSTRSSTSISSMSSAKTSPCSRRSSG